MLKRTLIFIIFNIILFSPSMPLYSMNNNLEMVEIIRDGQKVLIPLAEIAKKITPLISPQQSIKTSANFLGSAYNFFSSYPKETIQALGYATLFCSILWFANSKNCFVSPGSSKKMLAEHNAKIGLILAEDDAIEADIQKEIHLYNVKKRKKRAHEAEIIDHKIRLLDETIRENLELLIQTGKALSEKFSTKQKENFERIVIEDRISHERKKDFFTQKKQKTEESINAHFDAYERKFNDTRENIEQGINHLLENLQCHQTARSESNQRTKSQLDDLGSDITQVEELVKNSNTERKDAQKKHMEDLTLISSMVENFMQNESNTSQNNQTNRFEIIIIPALEN